MREYEVENELDMLTELWQLYCNSRGFPLLSADELLVEIMEGEVDGTDEDCVKINAFIRIWERTEE